MRAVRNFASSSVPTAAPQLAECAGLGSAAKQPAAAATVTAVPAAPTTAARRACTGAARKNDFLLSTGFVWGPEHDCHLVCMRSVWDCCVHGTKDEGQSLLFVFVLQTAAIIT